MVDKYIEAELLDLAGELGAEVDSLRDLDKADDLASPHICSHGVQNGSCIGACRWTVAGSDVCSVAALPRWHIFGTIGSVNRVAVQR